MDLMVRTRISLKTLILALFYLERLKSLHPMCKGSEGSAHRLFLSALIVASKMLYDDTFHNLSWAQVSLFPLEEINKMEMEFLYFLGYRLHVDKREFDLFVEQVDRLLLKWNHIN